MGGSCIFTPAAGQWKGQPYFAATSGRIVYNANTACYYKNQFPWTRDTGDNKFLEVTVHELLHALGLGHSCGDDDSPKCSTSALLDNATMRATTHTDGRGNRIFEDDLSGFWQFYDPNYFAAPCDLPPGHKNFCKRCGPCGLLQGACKKNSDCYGALECKSKVCS